MTDVMPGVKQLKIPLPDKTLLLGYVNLYLIKGKSGYLLIDTGWPTSEALNSLKSQMAEIGVNIKEIKQIASTHSHFDHYGMGGKLREISGAKLMIHQEESNLFSSNRSDAHSMLQRELQWLHDNGMPDAEVSLVKEVSQDFLESFISAQPDIILKDGDTISTGVFNFKVLWTPGHSPGHICLYEADKKFLIAGDHVLPTITPHIGVHPHSGDNPLVAYIKSLEAIRDLDVNVVLPAHENPFTNLQLRIDELIHHHELRNSVVLKAMDKKPQTAYQIATKMTWLSDIRGVSYEKLAPMDKRLALLEAIAHLDYMLTERKVNKSIRNSLIYYQAS